MKIIESLKELRVIEKRMASNIKSIGDYSSSSSTYKHIFGTEEKQRKEIASLIQANEDLMNRYIQLKRRIESTNLKVVVSIESDKYTISELLILKRKMASVMEDTYEALSDHKGERALMSDRNSSRDKEGKQAFLVRYYDEKHKNAGIRKWQDLYNTIDSRLEIINATTDLLIEEEVDQAKVDI